MNWWLPEFYNKIITECSKMSGQLLGPYSLQNLKSAKMKICIKIKINWGIPPPPILDTNWHPPPPLVDNLYRKNVHFTQFIKISFTEFWKGMWGDIVLIFQENIQGVKIKKDLKLKSSNASISFKKAVFFVNNIFHLKTPFNIHLLFK